MATVSKVASLARLGIAEEKQEGFLHHLQNVLDLFSALAAIDTEGISPMAHPQRLFVRLRPDEVAESDESEALLSLSPKSQAGFYLVPRVVE